MTNSNLNDKNGVLQFFFHHIQNMSETTYYQKIREVILNRAKDYFENNKELLRERAKNRYRELFEEEKDIKREYGKKKIS